MKITKIECPKNAFADNSLKKGIINDYLFEKKFFEVYVEEVLPIEFLYRRMYEELYLKRDYWYECSKLPENGKMKLLLSVSEAILFIKSALPPVFKPREKEAIESIDAIKETLMALLTGKAQYDYIDLFKRNTGLNYFETKTNYDTNRIGVIRKFNSIRPVVDVIITPISYNDLYDGIEGEEDEDAEGDLYREPTLVNLHVMFNCIKKSELELIYKIIDESNYYYLNKLCQVHILNIFHSEFNGYYVEMYIENFDSEICKTLHEIYRMSYKTILNK